MEFIHGPYWQDLVNQGLPNIAETSCWGNNSNSWYVFDLHFCLEATWVGLLLSWQTLEIVQEFNVAEAFLAAADEINCPQLTSGTSFQSSVCHKKFKKIFINQGSHILNKEAPNRWWVSQSPSFSPRAIKQRRFQKRVRDLKPVASLKAKDAEDFSQIHQASSPKKLRTGWI